MVISTFHKLAISYWIAAVILVAGVTLASGADITAGRIFALFLLAGIPPVVMVMVFRGAPEQTIGEILYDAEHAGDTRKS